MTTDPRNLAKELARKKQQAQGKEQKPSAADLKQKLTDQLAQRKMDRKELLKDLAKEEKTRHTTARWVMIGLVVLAALGAFGYWRATAKARQARKAAAAEQQKVLIDAEAFCVTAMKDYTRSGMTGINRYWDTQTMGLARSMGDARIKAEEHPAEVRIVESFPGTDANIYEVHCREDSGAALLIRLRRDGTSFHIIGIE
jgi:hypothetical protein